MLTILDAIRDPSLFASWFRNPSTWPAWFAFLAALFALPMDAEALPVYRNHTGRKSPPLQPAAAPLKNDQALLSAAACLPRAP